jgi:hypothetical protein
MKVVFNFTELKSVEIRPYERTVEFVLELPIERGRPVERRMGDEVDEGGFDWTLVGNVGLEDEK